MSQTDDNRTPGLITRMLSVVRWTAFDTSDESGRSKERYRRAALAALASTAARGIGMLTSLITVPLTLNYLGAERYGVWVTMSSMIAMLGFADLGIGNGLMNAIANASGRSDREDSARFVSSGFFALAAIALMLGGAFAILYPLVPWPRVFNVQGARAAAEAGPAVAALLVTFLVGMPLSVVSRVRRAHQQGFADSIWGTVGSLAGLGAVLIAVSMRAGLPALALSMAGAPLGVVVLNGAWLFSREYPWLRPRWGKASSAAAKAVLGTGLYFFILQVAVAVAYQSDSIVVAQILGPASVAQYAVPMKLFMLVPSILGFAFTPLWPAYAEALARGDHAWAWTTMKRSVVLALVISIPVSVLLVLVARPILDAWVGPSVRPDGLLLVAAGVWAVVNALSQALAVFLNGAGILRFQAISAVFMMIANLGLSIVLTLRIGVSGVLWGSVTAQTLCILVPVAVYLYRRRRREIEAGRFGDLMTGGDA